MAPAQAPIRRKLMTMFLLTSGAVLLLASATFLTYEFFQSRAATLRNLTTLGRVIATNSTAALAFDNADDAKEILKALAAEPQVIAAGLYDAEGTLFARYPDNRSAQSLPRHADGNGYQFERAYLVGFQPVLQGERRMGTLYLQADMRPIYQGLIRNGGIAALVVGASLLLAYVISRSLQRQISRPILALAETAKAISDRGDYSVRAAKPEGYEFGLLTDAFNHMLTRIQAQVSRLDLLQRITRAVGERQDLPSIFQVVLRRVEDDLPIDFGCVCVYDPASESLTTMTIGARSAPLAAAMAIAEQSVIPIDANGLSRCVRGQLVYEPDTRALQFPFPQRMAKAGLRSWVAAPLLVESKVFGVLLAARHEPGAFSSADCEFLQQLSEHVALATNQAQLYGALQRAYDDLRQTQQAVMQQERLRALGQMASGIAHDINNAISPVALYTESLLEREPNLSERARGYLVTIQRAIDDVAGTVSRMREFYRKRESQRVLARVPLNRLVQQVIDLTHPRWSDNPQERGVVIKLQTELTQDLPEMMGAEGEIRDALTNLIFNAVDAMPEGGTLTLRTRATPQREWNGEDSPQRISVEVSDTGNGMDEETRRRCLEPFYTTKGERGTGLGLAMVYGMVQRHSAELEIESRLGQGTTIRLIFSASAAATDAITSVSVSLAPAQRLRILLIDDDPMLIQSLRDILEADGHVITVADGGQAGIDTFLSSLKSGASFALVITDLGMPYVDGRKVAAAIRAASPATPIIMLTGWGQRLVAENDIPPYVDRVLNKPPRLHELRSTLAALTAEPVPAAAARVSA